MPEERNDPFPGGLGLKAVLFDFDGTLTASALDFGLMRQRVFEVLAPFAKGPLRPEAMIMEELERLTAYLTADEAEKARKAAFAVIEDTEMEAAARSSLLPFVRPMFSALRSRGIASGVITRNFPPAVLRVFPDLHAHAGCLLTRQDVARVKPHPEHLEKALDILGVLPECALMIGDHLTDIRAGKRAGVRTAGVGGGECELAVLAREEPDYLASDAGELMRMLTIL